MIVKVLNKCDECEKESETTTLSMPEGWIAVSSADVGMLNLCSWKCVRKMSRHPKNPYVPADE